MGDDALEIDDERIEFVAERCIKSLKQRMDKWNKMFIISENSKLVMDFLDKTENEMLVISYTKSGLLTPSLSFPTKFHKKKLFYMIKKSNEPIPKGGKIRDLVTYGDMFPQPLEQLACVIDQVCSR